MNETQDQRAERLLALGIDTAIRIRDEAPAAVARPLDALDRAELRDLVILLAACIDIDQPHTTLLAWWHHPDLHRLAQERGQPAPAVPADTDADRARRRRELVAALEPDRGAA